MSVTSGGTALNPCSSGGRSLGSAGSAGISMIFLTFHWAEGAEAAEAFFPPFPPCPPSLYHTQIDDDRSLSEITTPTNPYAFLGSRAGRSSSVIWYSSPSGSFCWWLPFRRSHTWSE